MAKIKVYRKDTGDIVHVPAHWMDHPVLSAPFRKTPRQRAREAGQEAAAQTSTPRTGEVANPQSTDESAKAGDDDKKE